MSAKFEKGSKVKIVSRGRNGTLGMQEHIGKSGVVSEAYWYSMSGFYSPTTVSYRPKMRDYYCYTIRLRDGSKKQGIPEDALELVM